MSEPRIVGYSRDGVVSAEPPHSVVDKFNGVDQVQVNRIGRLPELAPHEHMAVVTAFAQVQRGEVLTPSVATMCVQILAAIAGVDIGHEAPQCARCRGCGKLADRTLEPWSVWELLPNFEQAVILANVAPVDCPDCDGTGEADGGVRATN